MRTIVVATGNEKIDNAFSLIDNYKVMDSVTSRGKLVESITNNNPDILIISDSLRGSQSIKELLFSIKASVPTLRIIYIVGDIDMRNRDRVDSIGYLVLIGIYDIITERKFNMEVLKRILNEPKSLEDVSHFTKNISTATKVVDSLEFEEEVTDEELEADNPYNKIVTFSSVKPGSGKSTISISVATAIAKYGKKKENDMPPRVAVLEGDLQNLSVGTLLHINNDPKFNLKTALNAVAELFNDNQDLVATPEKMDETNKFIKKCFKPYYYAKNLHAITGSQISYEEFKNVKPNHFVYLIEAIIEDFDVIIVDSNSNLAHPTTEPLLYLSRTCYYITSLDFNNIRNNSRYKSSLKNMNIYDKVKYVLNEDLEENSSIAGTDIEELEFTKDHLREVGFDFVASIPLLPKSIYLNRVHSGKPVVLDSNDVKHTNKCKYEFLKLANDIWPIENLEEFEKELLCDNQEVQSDPPKKKGFWR